MGKTNIILLYVLMFLLLSCSKTPTGIYEGEIGNNKVLLDFTTNNIVIVKYSDIHYYNSESIYLNKEKCSWINKENAFFVWDDKKNLKYILNFKGKDLIERSSGERLVKKTIKEINY